MSDSDTLLICFFEERPADSSNYINWLVTLSRNGSEWREAQRVQADGSKQIGCALSDSRGLLAFVTMS